MILSNCPTALQFCLIAIAAICGTTPCRAEVFDRTELDKFAGSGEFRQSPVGAVLAPGSAGQWDAGSIGSISVIQVDGRLHMYYEAWAAPNDVGVLDFSSLQIGHAVSTDGVHWVKDPANPVISRGQLGNWDADGTWDPFVIFEDGKFKVWYGGGVDQHCDYGYAESRDGSRFDKRGQISHIGRLSDGHVVHRSAAEPYFLYYFDKRFEPRNALFCARSNDEMDFDFDNAVPIRIEGESSDAMYKFSHVVDGHGGPYMFYANFVRPHANDSTTRLAKSEDGIHWKRVSENLFSGHDAEVVSINPKLHLAYFSQRGFYNRPRGDVRLAVYAGDLADLDAARSNDEGVGELTQDHEK